MRMFFALNILGGIGNGSRVHRNGLLAAVSHPKSLYSDSTGPHQ